MRGAFNSKGVAIVAVVVFLHMRAASQQDGNPQQQGQELKQQYEQTTKDMQQRIAALEQQIENEKQTQNKTRESTISAEELAAQGVTRNAVTGSSNQVGAKYQGQVALRPTYDELQEAENKIEGLHRQVGAFEFQGYFRSGYGLNSEGGQQVAFQAPGAEAKYRLGNEAETYGEFIFVNNWLNPEEHPDQGWVKTEIMVEANTTNSTNYAAFPQTVVNGQVTSGGNDQFRLREAFVRGGHFLGDTQPDAIFWAGERYYRRQHVEINDFYPLDLSGYGAGFEDVRLGNTKLAVAFLAGARPDITTQNGNYAKSNIDVRLYDVKGPLGLYGAWFDFATSKGGTTPDGTVIPTSSGEAFGFKFQHLEWHGGYHAFSIQYGTGAASNFSSPGSGTVVENPTPFINSQAQFLITEQILHSQTTQAFNSLGTTIAPKLGGLLILAAAPLAVEEMKALSPMALHLYRVQEAASVKMPYTVIGIALLLLAVLIATSKLPTIPHAEYRPEAKGADSVWKHPNLVFGAIAIFAYVGAEVSIGSFLVNYFGQSEIAGLSAKSAAGYVSFYWAGAMLGRFLGAGLLRKFRPGHLLGAFAICTPSLVSLSMLTHGHFAMWSILIVGFFNSIMFPTIFSLGVAELGPLTGNGSGILNMAIVGGAIVPLIQSAIADHIGIHHAFFIPVICYLYILYYALSGSRPNSERHATA